jgi:hypothetical protein
VLLSEDTELQKAYRPLCTALDNSIKA